jgi:hypothetical protein
MTPDNYDEGQREKIRHGGQGAFVFDEHRVVVLPEARPCR